MKRRSVLIGSAAIGAVAFGSCVWSRTNEIRLSTADDAGRKLPIPDLLDVGTGSAGQLDAIASSHQFIGGQQTPTLGFGQSYLGPVVRVKRGQSAQITVTNKTNQAITTHWHGLHVNGAVDGGPHTVVGPGRTWSPELAIDQPAATLWYHSHIHGRTADQVYAGLAGMMIVQDPSAPPSALPETYGVDDIPLIVQDRAFDASGRLLYSKRGPNLMHGFRANEIVVNGAIRPMAAVPRGLVRLRILNASNARIYTFSFEDNRRFHQVGTDGGLLNRPIPMNAIMLAPAERAEIIVDFSDGAGVRLLSSEDTNNPMGGGMMGRGMMGMMGGGMISPEPATADGRFEVMRFAVDATVKPNVTSLPDRIGGAVEQPDWGEPVRRREFRLDMHMGAGMGAMMGRMMRSGGNTGVMGINGRSMAMDHINLTVNRGETELWEIVSDEMDHPFHVHGTAFQVLSHNGRPVAYERTGLKDVVLVRGRTELLVHFRQPANRATPYMYHCHILEHEDAGMMGQFTVT